jgi:transposase
MAKPLLPDELWAVVQPLLPPWSPSPKGGQPRLDDRKALLGILFVLKTGIAWEDLPCELGCGSGMTCWRRLRDWQADGTWARVHAALLARLHAAGQIDWSRAAVDSSSVRAIFGGRRPGRTRRTVASQAPSTTCS